MHHWQKLGLRNGIRLALGVGLIGLDTFAGIAAVQAGDLNSRVALDIPQQSLASALTSLANQADLQILFSQGLVAGTQSVGLSGSYFRD